MKKYTPKYHCKQRFENENFAFLLDTKDHNKELTETKTKTFQNLSINNACFISQPLYENR